MKYAIVIPAKNEERNLPNVLDSVAKQSIPPVVCLLIDDDSTDRTSEILESYKKDYPFFDYYKTEGSISYQLGAHVVNLFSKGVNVLHERKYDFDYVVKLDADVIFEGDVFEKVAQKLKGRKYGIVSPGYYVKINDQIKNIYSPVWHTSGQFKIYNLKCFEEMGGLKQSFGWDCADNVVAIDKGWETESFTDIWVQMGRPIGRYSLFEARRRQGVGAYLLGYDVLYLFMKGVFDFKQRPYFIGSFVYWYYFLLSALRSKQRILNKRQIKLLRKLFWSGFRSRFN